MLFKNIVIQYLSQGGKGHDESLKTIEELHLDFVQQQKKMDVKQSYFQPGQFQEEIFRGDDSRLQGHQGQRKDILFQAPQQHQQAITWNQIEVQRQGSKTSSQVQDTYMQMQQLQPTQPGEQSPFLDKIESRTGGGQSLSNPYRDRLHHNNIQALQPWNQPLPHADTQPDMNLQKISHQASPVHNHEHFQYPPPNVMV